MKIIYKKIMPYILSLQILTLSLFSCPITVYASSTIPDDYVARDIIAAVELSIEKKDFKYFTNFLYDSADGLIYLLSQMGAVVTLDFPKWVNNNKALETLVEITPAKKEGDNIVFTKELFTELKVILDDYIAENQPFKIEKTYRMAQIPASAFGIKPTYEMFKSYFGSSYSYVVCNPQGSYGFIGDLTSCIKGGGGFIKNGNYISAMDGDWKYYSTPVNKYFNRTDEEGKVYVEIVENFGTNFYLAYYDPNKTDFAKYGQYPFIVTPDGGNIRVFNTGSDFINYSAGQRKIYYTSNYYDYVPEDLQVSIDDLQKTIDDMQDVIDKLLDQITNNTSESEIEELLRLILEELKNNQGGGDGSGGGDVNVDIDLSTTNGILSKILAKVTQISEKISASAGQSVTDVVNSIKELGEMLKKYLITITNDLDDIKTKLDEMSEDEFSEKTDSFLKDTTESFSEISDVAKGKFPFSIPNDMRILLERIASSPLPPEPEAYTLDPADQAGFKGKVSTAGSGMISVCNVNVEDVPVVSSTGAPVFCIPFVIKSAGIDYTVMIDLSGFDEVSKLGRTLFTIMYILCLYNLTFKVMGLWGDLVE